MSNDCSSSIAILTLIESDRLKSNLVQADLNAMSNVNIRRAINNIRSTTTVYTPIIEMIVNAIQAIDETGRDNGIVMVRVQRSSQDSIFNDQKPDIVGFEIEDNGIGFTDFHRNSFDTLYTDNKIKLGGKGFGRFTCLKYFKDLHIKSIYWDCNKFKLRSFSMGKEHDIIVNETVEDSRESLNYCFNYWVETDNSQKTWKILRSRCFSHRK